MKVITFYRYSRVLNPEVLRDSIREFCVSRGILGRVLLGTEGINGGVCGNESDIVLFKEFIEKHFPKLTYREQDVETNSYHKLVVRVRSEIVAFGKDVDMSKVGKYVTPAEFKSMMDRKEDMLILDARNDYEFDVGHFEGAKVLPISNFREFADKTDLIKEFKNKKIVMYCTGGIRCEKASAYLVSEGFKDVNHLQGGIINYTNKFKEHWVGANFVFDDRLVSEDNFPIKDCVHCGVSCSKIVNCHNLDCDKLTVMCLDCQKGFGKFCSKKCSESKRKRVVVKEETLVGVVENYFVKNSIAQVKMLKEFSGRVHVKGKTSDFYVDVSNAVKHPDNIVTFSSSRVRKNDKIYI